MRKRPKRPSTGEILAQVEPPIDAQPPNQEPRSSSLKSGTFPRSFEFPCSGSPDARSWIGRENVHEKEQCEDKLVALTRWRLLPFDSGRIAALARSARISPLVAQLLLNRGIDEPDQAQAFLQAKLGKLNDPETLPGVVAAADRIVRAIAAERPIVIYGDYDVDGVCGTSLLWACLRLAGARHVEYYIPHRVEEGYGLSAEAMRRLVGSLQEPLLITVDCGISAVAEAELARELGVELIVTDHHMIGQELPAADVLVHPRLPGSRYPCGDLCGAGVAFKLAWQICKSFGDGKKASPHLRDFLVQSLGLVAMATVADV